MAGLNLPLPRLGRHSTQRLDGISHRLTAIRREAVELRSEPAELLFLLRRQVLPGLHSPEDLLLPFRRQAVETLQPLLVLLLAFARKAAKCRVFFKRSFLFVERLLAMLVEPLPGMMSVAGWLVRSVSGLRNGLRSRLKSGLRLAPGRRRLGIPVFGPRHGGFIPPVLSRHGRQAQGQRQAGKRTARSKWCAYPHSLSPELHCSLTYGFALTSCWTCKSSSRLDAESGSGSANRS